MANEHYGGLSDIPGNSQRRRFIDNINRWLDQKNAALDRMMEVAEYREIRLQMLVASGMSDSEASFAVEAERGANIVGFEGRAVDLFAYRHKIIKGEGGITPETFQHALNTNPQAVIDDSQAWADLRGLQEATFADWAHTAEISDSYFENRG